LPPKKGKSRGSFELNRHCFFREKGAAQADVGRNLKEMPLSDRHTLPSNLKGRKRMTAPSLKYKNI
jgi:hypothetical protein